MNKDFYKSKINVLNNNKTIFSNMLIVTIASTIGLILKVINVFPNPKDVGINPVEIFFIILGILLIFIFIYILFKISEEISKLLLKLKEVDKNE